MEQHDFEVEISKDGRVRVHIRGVKGKGCLDYAKFLQEIVGRTQSEELTSEYYEPATTVSVDLKRREEQRQRNKP